jgi:hypothetical protein
MIALPACLDRDYLSRWPGENLHAPRLQFGVKNTGPDSISTCRVLCIGAAAFNLHYLYCIASRGSFNMLQLD